MSSVESCSKRYRSVLESHVVAVYMAELRKSAKGVCYLVSCTVVGELRLCRLLVVVMVVVAVVAAAQILLCATLHCQCLPSNGRPCDRSFPLSRSSSLDAPAADLRPSAIVDPNPAKPNTTSATADNQNQPRVACMFHALSPVSLCSFPAGAQVPETRGKTLEEITADLASSSPPPMPGARVTSKGGPRHVALPGSDEEAD